MTDSRRDAPRPIASLALLKAICGLFIALKLFLLVFSGVFQDEAYYWLWGQHLDLSYYDHPPLNAWLQGLSGAIFGWNRFALRLPVALALVADLLILSRIAALIAPGNPQHRWTTLLLFLGTPIFFAVTAVALPDHLLITFALAALFFVLRFLSNWPEKPRWSDLYLGAAAIGLATLSKYNGAFLGFGLALAILLLPRLRPLLVRPQLYLAALIAVAIQAPVIVWNLQQGMASYGFILGGRHAGLAVSTDGLRGLVIGFLLVVGPFLAIVLARFAIRSSGGDGWPRVTFWLSSLTILALSLVTNTLFHWNLVAYLAALPFLAFHIRWRWQGWLHILYATAFLGFMCVNYAIAPATDVEALADEATAWAYGWNEAAAAVGEARAAHPDAFIATPDYTTAALLAFALKDKDVTSLSPRRDQFDYWFDAAGHVGKDAILLADRWRPLLPEVAARFATVTPIRELPLIVNGRQINRFSLFLAQGFAPALP